MGHLLSWKNYRELWNEYRSFTIGQGKDLAPYDELLKRRGVIWPFVNGKEVKWRYNEKYDPYVSKGKGIEFYKAKADGKKATIWARPYEPAPEVPDKNYPFWLCTGRVLEHWHTGSMTRRIPELNRAVKQAVVDIHPADAKELKIKKGDKVKLTSKRGSVILIADVNGRTVPQKGLVFVPFFDENHLINWITLDASCPISRQPDFKKCAVKVEKA